jgi:hypothetical protein
LEWNDFKRFLNSSELMGMTGGEGEAAAAEVR